MCEWGDKCINENCMNFHSWNYPKPCKAGEACTKRKDCKLYHKGDKPCSNEELWKYAIDRLVELDSSGNVIDHKIKKWDPTKISLQHLRAGIFPTPFPKSKVDQLIIDLETLSLDDEDEIVEQSVTTKKPQIEDSPNKNFLDRFKEDEERNNKNCTICNNVFYTDGRLFCKLCQKAACSQCLTVDGVNKEFTCIVCEPLSSKSTDSTETDDSTESCISTKSHKKFVELETITEYVRIECIIPSNHREEVMNYLRSICSQPTILGHTSFYKCK